MNYGSPDLLTWAVDQIGRVKAQDFQLGVYALSYVYAKRDPRVHNLLKASCAAVAQGASRPILEKLNLYKKVAKAIRESDAGASLEPVLDTVSTRLVESFSIHKHSSELDAYLARLLKIGIEHIVFGYPQDYSEETVQELSQALKLKP